MAIRLLGAPLLGSGSLELSELLGWLKLSQPLLLT